MDNYVNHLGPGWLSSARVDPKHLEEYRIRGNYSVYLGFFPHSQEQRLWIVSLNKEGSFNLPCSFKAWPEPKKQYNCN